MNSDKNEEPNVPSGWELCISKKNPSRKYYFNRKTGKSSWTRPQDEDPPTSEKSKELPKEKVPSKEEVKKIMKRKSDGSNAQSSSSKKPKEDKTPEKQTLSPVKKRASTGSIKQSPRFNTKRQLSEDQTCSPSKNSSLPTPSPNKRRKTRGSYQSPKPTPNKNTANARLSQLREDLSAEVKNEEVRESARPIAHTSSQNTTPKHTQAEKLPKDNQNDSQTIHSPSERQNESVTTTSPSQFFAANKIIYSMKAQLPDRDTLKAKDAFADIEEGINNQTTEYPFMKHPATPPQFSEASKLMSAIKSKLSYKSEKPIDLNIFRTELNKSETPKGIYNIFKSEESPINANSKTVTFRSAKDRMETLRTRLSNEMDTHAENVNESQMPDSMDVDMKETRQMVPEPKSVPDVNNAVVSSKENVVLVVDTNIFIHELDFIKNIMNSHIEGYTEQPSLLVPWRVINELDKLKDSNNGNGAICKRARPAMDYLYKSLPESTRIKVQPLRDANSHIYPCESPDDEILNCCLQQAERGKSVILLSNDKNLCNKAVANGVQTKQLRALVLTTRNQTSAAPLSAERLERHIYTLLSNILENEMRAKYDNLWLHVLFKEPPWTLSDVLQCLLKHWIAVFNEVFPRIEYLIIDLKNSHGVIERKNKNRLTHSEVSNFRDICLEVAKRCQIIPEYMELARQTVDKLEKDNDSGSDGESDKDGETAVITALEGVWTVFSSYCAKLASALGIEHSLEDKLHGSDSLEALTSKLTVFGSHIATLATAMEGVLGAEGASGAVSGAVSRLQCGLAASLAELGSGPAPAAPHIRTFALHCRNMLQEAQGKFSELSQLLTACRNTLQT